MSDISGSKKFARLEASGSVNWTRVSRVMPNQDRISAGRELNGPSTTARSNIGSVAERESNMDFIVILDISDRARLNVVNEGM